MVLAFGSDAEVEYFSRKLQAHRATYVHLKP